jgi:hypothetical protein
LTIAQLQDIGPTLSNANFRGMALAYLGGRISSLRKDLIALQQTGTGSQLLIRRANLNYMFP